jgi:HlyD family secretion protein
MLFVPPDTRQPAVAARLRALARVVWRWRYQIPLILAAGAALWYYGVPRLLGPVVQAEAVVRADFVQSVVASGSVLAPYRVNIGSQIVGVVADVPVAEGQVVKAGETLVTLDDREARASVVQAEGALAQADARLRQMRELTLPSAEQALAQAQATLLNAQQAYDRAQKLAADGFGTRATLDDATKALSVAQSQVRSAEFQVYTNRPGGSDYVMAETQLNQARASLTAAHSRLSYTTITAPRDGVLISRNVERGYVVQPANVLMVLSPFGETQLTVQIDEKNLGLIAIGQKAIASADAYASQSFPAEVVYINPGVDLQRASVQVKLRVPDPPPYLQQDMTVSVDIETARRPAALIIPMTTVHGLENGKPWVMKVDAGHARRQEVKLGLTGAGKAEILAGLQEGDLVLPANSPIKADARLRARTAAARAP